MAWPRAGLMGIAAAVNGAALVACGGAGNAGKTSWFVPVRERRFVRLCSSARRLAAMSLVAVAVRLVAAALVAAEALALVAERTGGACARVAVIGPSKRSRRACTVFTMMNELERVVLFTVWWNLMRRVWLRRV